PPEAEPRACSRQQPACHRPRAGRFDADLSLDAPERVPTGYSPSASSKASNVRPHAVVGRRERHETGCHRGGREVRDGWDDTGSYSSIAPVYRLAVYRRYDSGDVSPASTTAVALLGGCVRGGPTRQPAAVSTPGTIGGWTT